jgi:uncharacterized protein YecT (DUF1311 family)
MRLSILCSRAGFVNCAHWLPAALVAMALVLSPAKVRAGDILYINPAKTVRIEQADDGIYAVRVKNENQRAKLPTAGGDESAPDEFHISPDGAWLYALRHLGSGLRAGDLFELASPTRVVSQAGFNELAWKNAVKLHAVPRNFSAAGEYAMAAFYGWSLDSKRLLISVRGGEEKRSMREGFLYFNLQSKTFEQTDYLRKLTKSAANGLLGCAEPVDPLPSKDELAARFEALDQHLNQAYKERLAKLEKDRATNLRDAQRTWLKQRDDGLKLYLSLVPAAEQEKRRYQFLGDVTASRLDDFTRPIEQDL